MKKTKKTAGGGVMHLFAALLILAITAITGCDDGTSGGGGPNTLVITNIPADLVESSPAYFGVGIFPADMDDEDIMWNIYGIFAYNNDWAYGVVAGYSNLIDDFEMPVAESDGTYTATCPLYSASSDFESRWSGKGNFKVWTFVGIDASNYIAYTSKNPLNFTGGTKTVSAVTDSIVYDAAGEYLDFMPETWVDSITIDSKSTSNLYFTGTGLFLPHTVEGYRGQKNGVVTSIAEFNAVTWSLTGNISASTTINQNGEVFIGKDETATTLTVKVTSSFNTSVSKTVTLNIASRPVFFDKTDPANKKVYFRANSWYEPNNDPQWQSGFEWGVGYDLYADQFFDASVAELESFKWYEITITGNVDKKIDALNVMIANYHENDTGYYERLSEWSDETKTINGSNFSVTFKRQISNGFTPADLADAVVQLVYAPAAKPNPVPVNGELMATISNFNMTIKEIEPDVTDLWAYWVEPGHGVDMNYSVASDGVVTVNVTGTADSDAWWYASLQYPYAGVQGKAYTYKFEAWTVGANRTVNVQYYNDGPTNTYLSRQAEFTSTRQTITLTGESLPSATPQYGLKLEFQCANQIGTFYVKMLEVKEVTLDDLDATELTVDTWQDGYIDSEDGEEWFKFDATANTQYIHFNPGSLYDVYVEVYTEGGTSKGRENLYSFSGNTYYDSWLGLTMGDTYYIKVTPWDDWDSGDYQIGFTTSSTPPSN